jgi:hypothetical protein
MTFLRHLAHAVAELYVRNSSTEIDFQFDREKIFFYQRRTLSKRDLVMEIVREISEKIRSDRWSWGSQQGAVPLNFIFKKYFFTVLPTPAFNIIIRKISIQKSLLLTFFASITFHTNVTHKFLSKPFSDFYSDRNSHVANFKRKQICRWKLFEFLFRTYLATFSNWAILRLQ